MAALASVLVLLTLMVVAVACQDLASTSSSAKTAASAADGATTTVGAATVAGGTTEQTAGPVTTQPGDATTVSTIGQPTTSTSQAGPQPSTGTTKLPTATTSTTEGTVPMTGLSVGPWVSLDVEILEPNVETVFTTPLSPTQLGSIDSAVTLTFAYDPTSGQAPPGQLSPLKNRIYHVLWLMRSLEFDDPLPWTGQSLWDWFCASVDEIVFEQGDYYAYFDGKIHVPIDANDYCMLTDKFVDPSISGGLMDTMVLFIHEARHQQKAHSDGNDDKTIGELGSWGVQYYTYLLLEDGCNYSMDATTKQILGQHAAMVKNAHITQE
jgi:hypothetical protein